MKNQDEINILLKASITLEEHKKALEQKEAKITILCSHIDALLTVFEEKFESDEKTFDWPQMMAYVRAADVMNFFDRKGMQRRFLERMNELPY